MNLLFRFIRFLLVSILQILVSLTITICRLLLLPPLLAVLRLGSALVFFSFRATINGPTRFIDRLAGEWTQRILDLVDDREHIYEVYQLCRLMAGGLIVLGWIVSTLFTVVIFRVIYGWLFI